MTPQRSGLDRSGLASLDDLDTQEWKTLFTQMERAQEEFLSHEAEFRSPDYLWPRDALHCWSRVWEYPYVLHQLKAWRASRGAGTESRVMDFGCGVTFFPFMVAREGVRVIAVDIDRVVERDITRAAKVFSGAPGSFDFRLSGAGGVPLDDGEADLVYSVSVLEHVPEFAPTVAELARVLAPRGRLILTVDLCIEGAGDIRADRFEELLRCLEERFDWAAPERTVHPARVLDTESSPYPYRPRASCVRLLLRLAKRAFKETLHLKLSPPLNRWQCMGLVLDKRA